MIVHYLYYKLYQAALKSSFKDIPHIAADAWLGGLFAVNIILINAMLAKTIELPFLFSSPKKGGIFCALLIASAVVYFRKEKRTTILEKYALESNERKKRGNTIVAIYVALSFLLIFAVAFYKPGKL
ncbi:MAG: hypothetical protein EOP48_15110 [Sphingobacteriales bacterium]|nr:MAG: hypothetical protein EOP48_15110 [Sphingobacteriales bacterium]